MVSDCYLHGFSKLPALPHDELKGVGANCSLRNLTSYEHLPGWLTRPELVDGEAVLGSVQSPWKVMVFSSDDAEFRTSYVSFLNTDTGKVAAYWDDPRTKEIPMPPGWVQMPRKPNTDDPEYTWPARNVNTGKIINSDPRLFPEALAERGIPVKTITLA